MRIDQTIKRTDLVSWATGETAKTISLTAMDRAYLGALAALMSANPWLSNEPDESLTVRELDNVLFSLGVMGVDIVKAAIIWDEKVQGVNGGTFTSGAWRQRDLNTKNDPDNLVTVGSNEVTIAVAGKYWIRAICPAYTVLRHQARLLKNGISISMGTSHYNANQSADNCSRVSWVGQLVIGDLLTVQHICSSTQPTYGFGIGDMSDFGVEIYSVLEIVKLD